MESGTDPGLAEVVLRRMGELVAYQDTAYATRYATFVEHVREREDAVLGSAELVTAAVTRNLYNEVARLWLDPSSSTTSRSSSATTSATPSRSTRRGWAPGWTPVGRATVRVTERTLIEEYTAAVTRAVGWLSPGNSHLVAEIAELPDLRRGYEDIELADVAAFRQQLAALE